MSDVDNLLSLSDGPLADPSLLRPTGPNQMVNRMPNPAGMRARAHTHTVQLQKCQ